MVQAQGESAAEAYKQLFLAVAEELKLPLQHIGRQAELSRGGVADTDAALRDIQDTADMSARLLDMYLLSLRLGMETQAQLALEPVSLPAVLHDARQQLQATARQYGVTLTLHTPGRSEPVLANGPALTSALIALGYSLIEALPASGAATQRLRLATHRTKDGVVAGIYGPLDGLTPRALRRGQTLHGYVRQPVVSAMPGTGAGVFLADTVLRAMQVRLRVGRFQSLPGFAITLPASRQLQLV